MFMLKSLKTAATAGLATLSLLCASCSTVAPIVGAVTSITGGGGVQCSVSLQVAKDYYLFEAGYSGIAQTLSAVAGTPLLPTGSSNAQRVKTAYLGLIAARKTVEAAVDVCNTSQLASQVQT